MVERCDNLIDGKGAKRVAQVIVLGYKPKVLLEEGLKEEISALLILTAWKEFKELDLEKIKGNLKSPIIIDGVNIFNPEKMKKMGFVYRGVGREA